MAEAAASIIATLKLNTCQLEAVTHPPSVPLQILAGPGSGKTKVLTSRIAHLILDHGFLPSSICAVTFTNKAALEMKERLTKLIGKEKTDSVRLGTFHALCSLFLRRHSKLVGIAGNFTVCDADESKRLITNLLKPYKEFLSSKDLTLKEATVLSLISKAKAKGQSPEDIIAHSKETSTTPGSSQNTLETQPLNDIERIVGEVYKEYERSLRKSNCLDFDDLLVYGVQLFRDHPHTARWCKHILVDEFQDTNVIQYELMCAVADSSRCISIVGDPDQSIYGWRNAEIENLEKMQRDFPFTEQIFLEQNYRSTASILFASLAIVEQDKKRIAKTLHTTHPSGLKPVLRSFESEYDESAFIGREIKRTIAYMGGLLKYSDFVVLLRYNALSRTIEGALQREGIPSRVLAGHKFFERLEIKDLLAYLQLVDNGQYNPAFIRAVNVPSRGVGDKTLAELAARAEKLGTSQLEAAEKIFDGQIPDVKPPVKRKIANFVTVVRELREQAKKGLGPADLIRKLLDMVDYKSYLLRTQQDWESRWENVNELINFASDFESSNRMEAEESTQAVTDQEALESTPLRNFLQESMLSSEGDNQEEGSNERVTISTCHSAKGLEWPVVIVPAVEEGTFPFYRTDSVEEERRLLYVACTRAQGLLYLTHSAKRKAGGESKTKELSEFISCVIKENKNVFEGQVPQFTEEERESLCKVLDRPAPTRTEVNKQVAKYKQANRSREQLDQPSNSQPPGTLSASFVSALGFQRPVSLENVTSEKAPAVTGWRSQSMSSVTRQTSTSNTGAANTAYRIHPLAREPPKPERTSTDIKIDTKPDPVAVSTSAATVGQKRLGMGRGTGYSNKKFKPMKPK